MVRDEVDLGARLWTLPAEHARCPRSRQRLLPCPACDTPAWITCVEDPECQQTAPTPAIPPPASVPATPRRAGARAASP